MSISNGESLSSVRTKLNASLTKTDAMDQGVATTDSPTFAEVTVTGDFDVDTDTLFVDASTDRVGINTATPGQALDVVGNAHIRSGSYGGTPYGFSDNLVVEGASVVGMHFRHADANWGEIIWSTPLDRDWETTSNA